jgi:Tol biopolymer transport system component
MAIGPGGSSRALEGRRIGAYQLTARIGVGGMGDVYKARDTRLDRTVAIKVLAPVIANDPHFRQRFEREARAVAALNHPHICTLHDIGEADIAGDGSPDVPFLVMEFLEGETLSSRLARGALPPALALEYAVQLSSALDKAHRAGMIHRDLKPGNVMLTSAGAKLLDFGLAKYNTPSAEIELTMTGVVLGTIQYMPPEQLEGKTVDARTDIFSFGAVLYEMFTGQKAFAGSSQAALVKAILDHDPARLAALSPPALDRAVKKCLANDPDARWQSASDLASELAWIGQDDAAVGTGGGAPHRRPESAYVAWTLAAVLGVALIATVILGLPPAPVRVTPKRFIVPLADLAPVVATRTIALLPDGSGLVYLGQDGRDSRLYLHTLADAATHAIPGTEGALSPFASPDGASIGFVRNDAIFKVALAGGSPVLIGHVAVAYGATWGTDDHIVVAGPEGLMRLPATGGTPQPLTKMAPGENLHATPEVLPDGKTVLFTVLGRSGRREDATIAAVSLASGTRTTLVHGGSSARYSPTGHLLYIRDSDLVAVAFDPARLAVSGAPFLAAPAVRMRPFALSGDFDFAADGTLAYVHGGGAEFQRTLVWIDHRGVVTPIPVPSKPYMYPALLPDERSAVVEIEETPHNIWHADLISGGLTRLTHEGGNHRPVLGPDGHFMAFSSDRTLPRGLFIQPTDGSGKPEHLFEATSPQNATSWSHDGRWLAFTHADRATKTDIWVASIEGARTPKPFLQTSFAEEEAAFSPDGRWIAYTSDESGRREVMMTAFPGPGPRKQVSIDGGGMPVFAGDSAKIFYRAGDRLMAADIATAPVLSFGAHRVAFELPPPSAQLSGLANFAINRQGDKVLVVTQADKNVDQRNVYVVVNWFDTLRRGVAAK